MSESSSERSPRERQVDALIAQFEQAAEQGRSLNTSEFLKQHAEFAAELREYFADVGRLREVAQPHRPEPDETAPVFGSALTTLKSGMTVRYLGDYEILEELGSGGMGVVYKARQKKLKKIVALKMIKVGRLASDEEVRRFQAEARAAAKLDHPGIVAVHEVGVDHQQHYYAMDYVAGGSLSALCREQPVSASRAAEIVKKLAEAMHYAHSKNIIHRDLKPANVLLTAGGAPRITDFGLAKRLPSEDDSTGFTMTETGQVLGTAGYMSPEQAAGKTSLVSTSTDIYSLGAILYALLTSRAPFVGESPSVTILQVINKEPVAPRALNPSVPRDLETICLKCLQKEPHQRYGTAQLLADDLGCFLEGRPVAARPSSGPARGWRWCRRNPVVATLSAAIAVVLIVGIAASTTFAAIASHNAGLATARANDVTKKNQELVRINGELDAAQKTAEVKRLEAEQNATIAREQSQLALKSLESVIFDIQRKLENVQGTGDLRRSLLRTALARLQEVSEQFASKAAIDQSTVAALNDLGDVFLRIGTEARQGSEAEGPLAAARKAYQRAFDIAQKLAADNPNAVRAQRDLSQCYGKLGDAKLQAGEVAAALEDFKKGQAICEKWEKEFPNDTQIMDDLIDWHSRNGDLQMRLNNAPAALAAYQKGLKVSEKFAAADPKNVIAQRQLAVWYARHGDIHIQLGGLPEQAADAYERALQISLELAGTNPSAEVQRELTGLYVRLGHVLLESGQVQKSLVACERALTISLELARSDPSNLEDQRDLARSYTHLANTQSKAGLVPKALANHQLGLDIIEKLAKADPSDAEAQRGLSITYERLGDVHLAAGDPAQAIDFFQKGLSVSLKLATDNPSDVQAQLEPFTSYFRIAAAQEDLKQYAAAMESYTSSLNVLKALQARQQLPPGQEHWIGHVSGLIVKCKYAPTALCDWETLLKERAAILHFLLDFRGQQFIKEGRVAEARQAVAKLRELGTATAPQLYNAACIYSLSAASIKAETDELTAEQSAERQKHIQDALAALREAIAAGYDDFDHMVADTDLAILHDLPEFKKLVPTK